MVATTKRIDSGALVLVLTCERCGKPACYGIGVGSIREAITKKNGALMGRWYCRDHVPEGFLPSNQNLVPSLF